MKKNILTFVTILIVNILFTNVADSQHVPEFLFRTPILIQLDKGGQGSGFYVQDSLYTYLITARHVLIDQILTNNKTKKDSVILTSNNIRCISYPANSASGEKVILTVNLVEALKQGLLKYEKDADIGAIQIGQVKKINDSLFLTGYYLFANKDKSSHMDPIPRSIIQKYDDIKIGDNILIFGYPTSIGLQNAPQFDIERPLIRKGIIAGKNVKKGTVIIDCPTYYGNSGGPVIVEYRDGLGVFYNLIGVVSEFIPYEDDWINSKNGLKNINISNSGYSVVVPIESVFKLFEP